MLNERVVRVVQGPVLDNRGSCVNSIGEPGKILLDGERSLNHIDPKRPLTRLVFHEILRAVQHIDDEFRVSRHIRNLEDGGATTDLTFDEAREFFTRAKNAPINYIGELQEGSGLLVIEHTHEV